MLLESKPTLSDRSKGAAIALLGLAAGFATSWLSFGWSMWARMALVLAAVVCVSLLAGLLMRVRIRRPIKPD